jgi:hypothetical protein
MKKLIVISDAASDPLYNQELRSTIEGSVKGQDYPFISFVPCNSNTIQSGFLISQIVKTEEYYGRAINTILFVNNGIRDLAQNTQSFYDIYVIRLKSGMYLCGFNIGYNFSFIKEDIEEIFSYQALKEDENPLRSDSCLRLCAHLIDNMQDDLELDERSSNIILQPSHFYVAQQNSFQELYTTLTKEVLEGKYKIGDLVTINVNGQSKQVRFADRWKKSEEPLLYPYSSNTQYNPFMVLYGLGVNTEIGSEIILT